MPGKWDKVIKSLYEGVPSTGCSKKTLHLMILPMTKADDLDIIGQVP